MKSLDETTDQIWSELVDDDGIVNPTAISDEYIEEKRQQVIRGEIAPFIVTDLREGYGIYARNKISQMCSAYRNKTGRGAVRGPIPLNNGTGDWVRAEQHPAEAARHARKQLGNHFACGARVYGQTLVKVGQESWEDVRVLGHQEWDAVIDKAQREDEATTAPLVAAE